MKIETILWPLEDEQIFKAVWPGDKSLPLEGEQSFKEILPRFWPDMTHIQIWLRYHPDKQSGKVSLWLKQNCGL